MIADSITTQSLFRDAAESWLSFRRIEGSRRTIRSGGYIKPNTDKCYAGYIRSLTLFFGDFTLAEIGMNRIREFQRARLEGSGPFIRPRRPHEPAAPCPAGPKKVNQEMQVVIRILKCVGCWTEALAARYEPLLSEETDVPRALQPQEQHHWLEVSKLKERWMIVHWYSIVAFQTTLSTNEMRGLRLGDVNLAQGVLTVPVAVAKTKRRARTVPMNTPEIRWALEKLIERARECGSVDPQHFLFPFRMRGMREGLEGFDPTRPMTESGIKRVWGEVREASGLRWFRMYDTRHTAITRMSEAGIPSAVVEEYAGHVSAKMRRHYTHISEQAKRAWGQWAFSSQALTVPVRPQMPAETPSAQAAPPREIRPTSRRFRTRFMPTRRVALLRHA